EKAFLGKILNKLPQFISHIYALVFIVFGWFIFIYCDLENPTQYLQSLFMSPFIAENALYDFIRSLLLLAILVIGSTKLPYSIYCRFKDKTAFKIIMCVTLPLILLICTAYLVDSSYNPFLYFRF
ncbi:MAG: MBOAT family protein, partial [Clostridia bacterium]|nr:MBOAT family protein [Clostridia bacterium]